MGESVFERDRRIRNADLTMGQTFYLTTLNQFVGGNGHAWPSQPTIAAAMNASERAVRKWQTELEAMGVIRVDGRRGRTATNQYRLCLELLPLKQELSSAFTGDANRKTGTEFLSNTALSSGENRNSVPVERSVKDQGKDQAISFPEILRTPEFENAWSEWVEHRREILKKLTPTTIGKQLRQLSTWGPQKAVRSIEASIAAGWTGLFDPDGKRGSAGTVADPAAESAWAAVLEAVKRHSRYSADKVRADLDERSWAAAKSIGLKRLDESSDFERKELRLRFIAEFLKREGAAA